VGDRCKTAVACEGDVPGPVAGSVANDSMMKLPRTDFEEAVLEADRSRAFT
jgi:hypothetical protein